MANIARSLYPPMKNASTLDLFFRLWRPERFTRDLTPKLCLFLISVKFSVALKPLHECGAYIASEMTRKSFKSLAEDESIFLWTLNLLQIVLLINRFNLIAYICIYMNRPFKNA